MQGMIKGWGFALMLVALLVLAGCTRTVRQAQVVPPAVHSAQMLQQPGESARNERAEDHCRQPDSSHAAASNQPPPTALPSGKNKNTLTRRSAGPERAPAPEKKERRHIQVLPSHGTQYVDPDLLGYLWTADLSTWRVVSVVLFLSLLLVAPVLLIIETEFAGFLLIGYIFGILFGFSVNNDGDFTLGTFAVYLAIFAILMAFSIEFLVGFWLPLAALLGDTIIPILGTLAGIFYLVGLFVPIPNRYDHKNGVEREDWQKACRLLLFTAIPCLLLGVATLVFQEALIFAELMIPGGLLIGFAVTLLLIAAFTLLFKDV